MNTETWAVIPGFPHYEASTHGRIRSHHREEPQLLSPFVSHGYLRVSVSAPDGTRHKRAVHTLVALAHIDAEPAPGLEVAHLDGDRANCAASNLRWVTHTENCAHKASHGTLLAGDAHPATKITAELRERVRREIRCGTSVAAVARSVGVSAGYLRKAHVRWGGELGA